MDNIKTLRITASDNEVQALVAEWSELLAEKKFRTALEMFLHVDIWGAWTALSLEKTIAGYGSPDLHPDGVRFEIASLRERPDSADIIEHSIAVNRKNLYGLDPTLYLGMVHYDDVPVRGYPEDPLTSYRSDMTARYSRAVEVRLSETDKRSNTEGCSILMSTQVDNRTSKDPDFNPGCHRSGCSETALILSPSVFSAASRCG